MTKKSESQRRLARPLIQLAQRSNVATSYIGQTGDYNEIDDEVLVQVLAALGVKAHSDAEIQDSLAQIERNDATSLVPGTVFALLGTPTQVTIHHRVDTVPMASIILENGERFSDILEVSESDEKNDDGWATATLILPQTVPMGYHQLEVRAGEEARTATLIVAPEKVPLPSDLEKGQLWGWMAQLYSIRSHDSWGVGDFEDLRTLLVDAHLKTKADYMLINPLHAAEPVGPLTPSPYLPDSRRFVNFTYIRPEEIDEYRAAPASVVAHAKLLRRQVEPLNDDASRIDRNTMWNAKAPLLRDIFEIPRSAERQASFDRYKSEQGSDLDAYATWCVAYEQWGRPSDSPESWTTTETMTSPRVVRLVEEHSGDVEFYRWLEWVADSQLAQAQSDAKASGMSIGLMLDMAVGVHPLGADVWAAPERFARGATVGAPPDYYNQQGQNWSQPPLNPRYLEKTGYKAYRDLIRQMFRGAGALRIDHILGLFRLWWIPEGSSADKGTYVGYDSDVMLGVLAIEATRAGGVVIGEDLGVVPPYVASALKSHGLLGSVIEWFEKDENGDFKSPDSYREYAIASVTTHDLPPTAGYLNYEHVRIRKNLHLFAGAQEEAGFEAAAHLEHAKLLRFLVDGGWLTKEALLDEGACEQQIIEAMHKVLKASKSKLLCAAVVDGVGERRSQNQPGTNNEYPNWRIPLADDQGNPVFAEDLFSNPRVRSLGKIMDE
ncbi:MAG: 4-alpha-glucanotransferase [Bifidobacteriaceae bacterium]|nr:4-alpha-glucanotransferase [Bifidobacteriaceae bacterium]